MTLLDVGWIFVGVFAGSIITLVISLLKGDERDRRNKEYIDFLKRDSNFYKNAFDKMYAPYKELKHAYNELSERCRRAEQFYNSDSTSDTEIQDAITYAMKKSHPDNGGTPEEFRKYREIYNKVVKKQ